MRYSRAGIIAVLLAAEVLIGGAILWTSQSEGKTFSPIDAGGSPHVVIDDPDDGVTVSTSGDGKVHVSDASPASSSALTLRISTSTCRRSTPQPTTDRFAWDPYREI